MASNWDKLREASTHNNAGVMLPSGIDLMRRINEGLAVKAPNEYIVKVKSEVTEACDELLDFGARIRPLMVDGEQIGWVRGLHASERKVMNRWIHDPNMFVQRSLLLATSLTVDEIERFTRLEINNLVELVRKMTDYDLSLYPYLSAFTTTMTSENLWHGKGQRVTSFENRLVEMPDGKTIKILTPPDHARLWATLCTYREQAKRRLDDNFNALMIMRPWVGKSANPLAEELKSLTRRMQTDAMEPWEQIVQFREKKEVLDNGWAHPENMETREGMLKELYGMLNNDKHEQLMTKFEQQQIAEAEQNRKRLEQVVQQRGGLGINEETVVVETEQDVTRRERDLRKGKVVPTLTRDTEVSSDPSDKIKRYSSQ